VGSPPRMLSILPENMVVSGESQKYEFAPEIVEKYLAGIEELGA